MKDRIQQEVDKTLECLEGGLDIPANPLFAEGLSRRMAGMRISPGARRRNRMSYPVVIALLLVLNLAAGLVSFKARPRAGETTSSLASVLANEYGLGQSDPMTF
jgi:hypothetical protein